MKLPEIPIERFEIFAEGLDHPEGLAFDADGNLWAGGEAGQVYRVAPDGAVEEICHMGGFCGGFAFSPEGRLFVCNAAHGVVEVTPEGKWSVFADHVGNQKIAAANFPAFDRQGRLYVSDSGSWEKPDGFVLRLDPDGRGEIAAGPFNYANGLAISEDDASLFMVETDTAQVYRIPLDDGRLGTPEVWAQSIGRMPDGLALDRRGNLYVSCYASDDIYKISPEREVSLFAYDPQSIKLGSPTNLAFGGEEMDVLYAANLSRSWITRAWVGVPGQSLAVPLGRKEGDRG